MAGQRAQRMMMVKEQQIQEDQSQRQARTYQRIPEKAEEAVNVELVSSALTNVPNE